jgi:CBS domain-containing protein
MLMWAHDCGALPVTDHDRKVIGMITDRDICMAVAIKGQAPAAVTVWETVSGRAVTCHPDDDVAEALGLMGAQQLHRLPVTDQDGRLCGLISMNDLILHATQAKGKRLPAPGYDDVMNALKGINAHRHLVGA